MFRFTLAFVLVLMAFPAFAQEEKWPQVSDCDGAKNAMKVAMQDFEDSYFERILATRTAENSIEVRMKPAIAAVKQYCPADIVAGAESIGVQTTAALSSPTRQEDVACDKAKVAFQNAARRVSEEKYPNDAGLMLGRDVKPAGQAAVAACPRDAALGQKIDAVIAHLNDRIDSLEYSEENLPGAIE